MTAPWDDPPQSLAKLEALWRRELQNAWCVQRAEQLCNSGIDAEVKLTGPDPSPPWCQLQRALWNQQLMSFTSDPPRQREYQRRFGALGLSYIALKNWRDDVSCMAEAALFRIEDAEARERGEGARPDWIYQQLYDIPQYPRRMGTKHRVFSRRTQQDRVARGTRLLACMSNASPQTSHAVADDPIERRLVALANVITVCLGARVVLIVSDPENAPDSRRLYTNATAADRYLIWLRWRTPSLSAARLNELSDEAALRARGIFVDRPRHHLTTAPAAHARITVA
jgi:hypothetical protein